MSFARHYPLTAQCETLCNDRRRASDFLGVKAEIGRTVFDTRYGSFDEADRASRSHPAFKSYVAAIESLQAGQNDGAVKPYSSAYTTPAFGFEASVDGIRLFVRHWSPAPLYPCGHDLMDILRTGLNVADRSDIPLQYGTASALRVLRLRADFNGVETVLERLSGTKAAVIEGDTLFIRYFPLKPPSPVLRRSDAELTVLGYARTAAEARGFTQTPAQLEDVRLTERHENAEDALAAASEILSQRWLTVRSEESGGVYCVTRAWLARPDAYSKRRVGLAGGGAAKRSASFHPSPALHATKGSRCADRQPLGMVSDAPLGELGLLTRGTKGHEPT